MLRRYLREERGQAATEYILIIGLISVPLYVAYKVAFELFLEKFVATLINTFTRG